ncbi:transposase [Jeotgalibaca arthritidis]|uniref:transposase n=1 Tax=Jeotgalibaca arthritidis TaxID=1868794 RepID=UPI001D059505|nr:transposase [Jeotgalibaca arthritidis]
MATLQEKHVNFNSKMVVNNMGGNLSTDSGLILVKEFMDSIGFSKLARQFLTFQDNRSYWLHDNISLLEQLLFQMLLDTLCGMAISHKELDLLVPRYGLTPMKLTHRG